LKNFGPRNFIPSPKLGDKSPPMHMLHGNTAELRKAFTYM